MVSTVSESTLSLNNASTDEIILNTKAVEQSLEALRIQLQNVYRPQNGDPESSRGSEFATRIESLLECGLGDIELIGAMYNVLQQVDAERQKLRSQVRRLCQENAWLRDELASSQQKLQKAEEQFAVVDEQKRQLEFLNELRKMEQTDGGETEGEGGSKVEETDSLMDGGVSIDQSTVESILGDEHDRDGTGGSSMRMSVGGSGSANHLSAAAFGGSQYEVPARLRTLHNLVIQYASQGRYEVAVPLCKQALEDLEKTSGREHPDVATMLNILALVYRDQGKYKDAASLLNQALIIREKTLGAEHPAVAATLNNLAVLYGKRGKYKEAEPLCKRALGIREKVLGIDHPDVAKQLNNLALLCQNQGKYEEAETYYERALQIYVKRFGLHDQTVIKTKNNLASAFLKQAKYKDAEKLYKDVLASSNLVAQTDSRNGTGRAPSTAADVQAGASPAISRAAAGPPSQTGVDLPMVTTTLRNLGVVYRRQGRADVAEQLEECATRSKDPLEALKQAKLPEVLGLNLVQSPSSGKK